MAQYYQVLSHTDKPVSEELTEYYPSIVDNPSQSVQYVIRPNEQAFQGSSILVSSDQLMVVDAQPQHLIVDQSQITFQNQQYILQDTNLELREGQTQQIYYMDESSSQQVEVAQTEQVSQTIVLNHQLPGGQVVGSINVEAAPKLATSLQKQSPPLLESLKQDNTPHQAMSDSRMPEIATPNRTVIAQKSGINPPVSRLATPIKARRPISQGPTIHYSPQKQEEMNEAEKNLLRYKEGNPESKLVKQSQVQSTNNLSNIEYEPSLANQPNRAQKKKPNRISTPRPNRTYPKNSKAMCNSVLSDNPLLQSRIGVPKQTKSINRNINQQPAASKMLLQPQLGMQQQPMRNAQFVVQPHNQQAHQQPVTLPPYVPSNQIKKIIESTPLSEEYSDSIRMLVLLSTGEQRLITFTLPKEQCTIQEILEQVGVVIEPETKIECNETNINGINYIVTVIMPQHLSREQTVEEPTDVAEDTPLQNSVSSIQTPSLPEPLRPPTPELPKEQPKYIQGMLAVCSHCGYLSEDFNKCLRCKRKLPEQVKSVAVADQATIKKNEGKNYSLLDKARSGPGIGSKTNGTIKSNASPRKKKTSKTLDQQEPIILTLSSDEEEDTSKQSNVTLKIVETHHIPDIKKEPSMTDIQKCDKESACDKSIPSDDNFLLSTSIHCRTIRIGSYRFVPPEDVIVNSHQIVIKVPLPNDPKEVRTITIEKTKIVKVLANFQKVLPVIFYYVMSSCSNQIRQQLNMITGSEYYFDPLSSEEAYKRITILPEYFADDTKMVFKQIYGKPNNMMEELTAKEANNILLKTCPKEVTKAIGIASCFTEIKQLLIYPPGIGGLSINTEDYLCLAQDQFLNDVIIDFYLKYLVLNLPEDKKEKVHVFSTFFYKRLTTKPLKASRRVHPSEVDSSLTPSQKRHARVKNWTKNVNIFEKDFIIVPINESCHWFLAIICYAGLDGCYTFDGKPVKLESRQRKKKLDALDRNTTATHIKLEKAEGVPCEDAEGSDKDEAEGDDSEMESEEDADDSQTKDTPIKQPCVLIFDSLAGASRSRVVATLRDYLACEYKIKMKSEKIFNKDTIKCACPKVPQQTNFTDCGLYLLQYVESFFGDPVKDYRLPIHQLKNWFEEIIVTKKREDIATLIKQLMLKYNKDPSILPDITFPTLNGKLLPRLDNEEEEEEEEDELEEEDEDEGTPSDDTENILFSFDGSIETQRDSETGENEGLPESEENSYDSALKPSHESISHNEQFDEQAISIIKPDLSEVKKTTSRDTLSYLKAKRIIRHKNSECSDTKKAKMDDSI